jgi:hypothetical protein
MGPMKRVHEYCCPSCGVVVLSGIGLAPDPVSGEDVCLFCAPYDPHHEDLAILFLQDALEKSHSSPEMGAARRPEPPQRPSNIMISPGQAKIALDLNAFLKMLLDILYEDAKFGTSNQIVRDGGKQIIDHVSVLIKAKLLDPGSALRQSPLIVTKEDTDRFLGILELLHTRYTQAHKIYVEVSENPEESRRLSYTMFWHIGSMIRTGQLATTVSPWITGEQPPRF